jgi:hypothetical protein
MKIPYSTTRTDIFTFLHVVAMFFTSLIYLLSTVFAEKELLLRHNKIKHQEIISNRIFMSREVEYKFVKEAIRGLAEEIIEVSSRIEAAPEGGSWWSGLFEKPSRSPCFEDLGDLSTKDLPSISSEIIDEACSFEDEYGFLNITSVRCDFQKTNSFISSFKSSCEDDQFRMILSDLNIDTGTTNLYYASELGGMYSVYSIKENDAPICLPKRCNYTEAATVIEMVENIVADKNGYQSVSYSMKNFLTNTTNSKPEEAMPENTISWWESLIGTLLFTGLFISFVWVAWYGYKNKKLGDWIKCPFRSLKSCLEWMCICILVPLR